MKKLLALVLVLACACTCGLAEVIYDGTAPVVDEPVKLTMLSTNGGSKIDDWSEMTYIHQLLEKANIDLDLDLVPSSAYKDVLKPRLAAGVDLPDIVYVQDDTTQQYSSSGMFYDLTDFVEKYGYGVKFWTTQPGYEDLINQMTGSDGRIYYFPFLYGTTKATPRGLVMNVAWLKEAGVDPENLTIEALDTYFHYVLEHDMNGDGDTTDEVPLFSRSDHIQGWGLYWGLDLYGTWQVHEDGTVTCAYTDPHYKDYLAQMHKWYEEGIVYNEYMTANLDIQNNLNSNNRMGCQMHFIANSDSYNTRIDPTWRYGDEPWFAPVKIVPVYGDYNIYGRTNTAYAGGFAINAECDEQTALAAFCFLDYCLTEDGYITASFGNEGGDWSFDENGKVIIGEDYLANVDNYQTKKGRNFPALPYAAVGFDYFYETNEANQRIEFIQKYEDELNFMMPMNFYFATEEQSQVLSMYRSDLNTFFAENRTAFITGTRSLDEFDDYVAQAEQLGLKEVLNVYQQMMNK